MISQCRLKELLTYDKETGLFVRNSNGRLAGSKMTGGYIRVRLDGDVYLCHRLAWLYVHGRLPDNGIDHINGVTSDNRLQNIREADHSQNGQNQHVVRRNKHGMPGVKWVESRKKWAAKIRVKGKEIHIGLYDCPEDASAAYLSKKKEIHPFFVQ